MSEKRVSLCMRTGFGLPEKRVPVCRRRGFWVFREEGFGLFEKRVFVCLKRSSALSEKWVCVCLRRGSGSSARSEFRFAREFFKNCCGGESCLEGRQAVGKE